MLHTFLNFICTMVCSVFIVFVCYSIWRWLDKKHDNKTNYRVTYEYMMFVLAKDHTNGSFKHESWQQLSALGADGWEIAETFDNDYHGIHYILKRQTLHQSC